MKFNQKKKFLIKAQKYIIENLYLNINFIYNILKFVYIYITKLYKII